MELKEIFEKVNFSERYRSLCDDHIDFDNRMRGYKRDLYERILNKFGYTYKYYSNGSFYKINETLEPFSIRLHLVLKDGHIEPLLYIESANEHIDNLGRFDFIPQKIDILFERKESNLPLYNSEEELEEILREIFSIYEDLKEELVKNLS